MTNPCSCGLEAVGLVAVAGVSSAAAALCGGTSMKKMMKQKCYEQKELTIERHTVTKIAQNVSCTKDNQVLGTGTTTFDGEILEMTFLPPGANKVAVGGMTVSRNDNTIEISKQQQPIQNLRLTFENKEDAQSMARAFQQSSALIPQGTDQRIADLRQRITSQAEEIKSLYQKASLASELEEKHHALCNKIKHGEEEVSSLSYKHSGHDNLAGQFHMEESHYEERSLEDLARAADEHQKIVEEHREEWTGHHQTLLDRITELEERIHPTRSKYEEHHAMLEQKMIAFENAMLTQGSLEEVNSLKSVNADLQIKVEQMQAIKASLAQLSQSLAKRVEAIEDTMTPRPPITPDSAAKVRELQDSKRKLEEHAKLLMRKLDEIENPTMAGQDLPLPVDPAMVARQQQLEAQLKAISQNYEVLIADHQAQLQSKDQELQMHVNLVQQSNQQLMEYQQLAPTLQRSVADYEQQVIDKTRHIQMLQEQVAAAQRAVPGPQVDPEEIIAERNRKSDALQRAQAAEAKLASFELEFQQAVNEANNHQLRAEREATNAQAEAARAQSLHGEREALLDQLEQMKMLAAQHEATARQLQDGASNSAVAMQQLAAMEAQQQQDQAAIRQLEAAVQAKDQEFEQVIAELQQTKDIEINELALTVQSKDQEVAALLGEVQTLKASSAVIPQLQQERDGLIASINKEREMAIKYEAELQELAAQTSAPTYERECIELQTQLQNSQQDLSSARAKIAKLQAEMANREKVINSQPVSQVVEVVEASSVSVSPMVSPYKVPVVETAAPAATVGLAPAPTVISQSNLATVTGPYRTPNVLSASASTSAQKPSASGILSPAKTSSPPKKGGSFALPVVSPSTAARPATSSPSYGGVSVSATTTSMPYSNGTSRVGATTLAGTRMVSGGYSGGTMPGGASRAVGAAPTFSGPYSNIGSSFPYGGSSISTGTRMTSVGNRSASIITPNQPSRLIR